ncbi:MULTISPECIES: nuclear transport factor 2 family protein [unclassified Sphingopyxis]|uniref:nuclear transport factor 2 family protein n=1 Tax=unclassified Sphingopyxis TaxID=2614943 RepID=UPI0009E94B1A|nr:MULTISPECIES: nuclear transport factor 2 family protein [unclassified Sphingopyxis]
MTGNVDEAEHGLRLAMLAGNVDALENMLGEHLIFTDQNGNRLSRADDIAAHRSGLLDITAIDFTGDPVVHEYGDTATVCVTADLAGSYGGKAFFGTFAYSRVWLRRDGAWKVILAHCSALPSAG